MQARFDTARREGRALRYLARLDREGRARVGLVSPEPGHAKAAEQLGLRPLLDFGIGHGEGVGAALAAGIVKAAALTSSGMAVAVRR